MVKGSDDNLRPEDFRQSDELRREQSYAAGRSGGKRDDVDGESKSSDAIRRDIERTRAELDRTVDALQERLSPEQLVHTVFNALRANAGDMVQSAARVLRDNPVPAVMIGIGVVWMMAASVRRPPRPAAIEYYEYDEYEGLGKTTECAI